MIVSLNKEVAKHKVNAYSYKTKCGPPVERYVLWETMALLFFYLRKLPSGQVGSS